MRIQKIFTLLVCAAMLSRAAIAQNPFQPPQATIRYAPNRDYDLKHVAITLNIDWAKRSFAGSVVNTVSPFRDNPPFLTVHSGQNLVIEECRVGGKPASFTRDGQILRITPSIPIKRGKKVDILIRYRSGTKAAGGNLMADAGLHWIRTDPKIPSRQGIWTQGETESNRYWVPTWDYPNDFATSEETITVPASWYVIGNGALDSNKLNPGGRTRTFRWRMGQPHATYLLSLCAGPFDIKRTKWRDVPLYLVAPKGMGNLLSDSMGDTPDMLEFFSTVTGVKYAWPKYALTAMYDFGGGMENISATTVGERSLTDRREGYRNMASLNAHETAHQWFGDIVTCQDWGHIWLNESFATFFDALYMEHSRGKNAYQQTIEGDTRGYLEESRRYKRPIATNLYTSGDAMFDAHTYPKGAVVIHTMRRKLGDAAFFSGLKLYLSRNRNRPVQSSDLSRALTEASGVNMEPFFDQWIFKPGHPVLDYTWTWDAEKKEVVMTAKQIQDTKDGTPIYDLRPSVGIISGTRIRLVKETFNKAEAQFRIPCPAKPDAVLLDPGHDFLREIPNLRWSAQELPAILRLAPDANDRMEAMNRMLQGSPSDSSIDAVVAAIRSDRSRFPWYSTLGPLVNLKRESLRPFFREMVSHPNQDVRAEAVQGLSKLSKNAADEKLIRGLINDRESYAVVGAALNAIAMWNGQGAMGVLRRAAMMPSRNDTIRLSALTAMARTRSEEGLVLLVEAAAASNKDSVRMGALSAMGQIEPEPRTQDALRKALRDSDPQIVRVAAMAVRDRKDKALKPEIEAIRKAPPANAPWLKDVMEEVLKALQG